MWMLYGGGIHFDGVTSRLTCWLIDRLMGTFIRKKTDKTVQIQWNTKEVMELWLVVNEYRFLSVQRDWFAGRDVWPGDPNCNCCTAAYLFTHCCLLFPIIWVAPFCGQFFFISLVSHFTALHWMQGGLVRRKLSVCLSVCLSVFPSVLPCVCLSVIRVHWDKMEERSVQNFISYERSFRLVFWEEEWLVGTDHFYLKFWVNRPPLDRSRRFWTDIRS